jgi:type VI secretion system protein
MKAYDKSIFAYSIVFIRQFFLLSFIFFLVYSLLSCGIRVRTRALFGENLDVKIEIADNANENSAVAVDLILVYDKNLLSQLLKLTSKDWFEKRAQIKRDHLKGEGLDLWSWEWVPGQPVQDQKLPLKAEAEGGLIFASYYSPGSHRHRFDPFKDIKIRLMEKEFYVETLK